MHLGSLDVKTAFEVAEPSIIAAMLGETGSAWVDCCGAVGGDEESQGKGQFRILPDGSQTLNMYLALRHDCGTWRRKWKAAGCGTLIRR